MTGQHPIARTLALLAALATLGCDAISVPKPNEVEFVIIQLGDIKDIRPQEVRTRLALVAGIKQRLLQENTSTFLVMPGDLFNPAPLGNVPFAGERVAGRNMVEVMNALGVDYATFGNHIYDLGREELTARLGESTARWVSTNVGDGRYHRPFEGAPAHRMIEVCNTFGKRVRVGLIGLTMREGGGDGSFTRMDPVPAARAEADRLAGRYDILLALTHLRRAGNLRLAAQVPEVHAIFGGQDGVAGQESLPGPATPPGATPTPTVPFFNADANASSVWVHRCVFDTKCRRLSIYPERILLDGPVAVEPSGPSRAAGWLEGLGPDQATQELLREWVSRFEEAFRLEYNRHPDTPLAKLPAGVVLNGLEDFIRTRPTNFTRLVGLAMLKALDAALDGGSGDFEVAQEVRQLPRLAIFNCGMVRINDLIGAKGEGAITLYHVHRAVPYYDDPAIRGVRMSGRLVAQLLKKSEADHRGQGGFLQAFNRDGNSVYELIRAGHFDRGRDYLVAIDDYLADGKEVGFEELNAGERGRVDGLSAVAALGRVSTVRKALEEYLGRGEPDFGVDPVTSYPPRTVFPVYKATVRTHTSESAPDLFGARDDGPFTERPEPLLGPIPALSSAEFVAEIEESLDLETEAGNRLRLAELLIVVRPLNRRAARELVAGVLSDDPATHAAAHEILAKNLAEAPPALVLELTKTMSTADDFTRAHLAELLTRVAPARNRPSR